MFRARIFDCACRKPLIFFEFFDSSLVVRGSAAMAGDRAPAAGENSLLQDPAGRSRLFSWNIGEAVSRAKSGATPLRGGRLCANTQRRPVDS